MIRTFLLFFPLLFLLLAGCSSKEYYKPENVVNSWPVCKEVRFSAEAIVGETPARDAIPKWPVCKRSASTLVAKGDQGAVSAQGRIVDEAGLSDYKIPTEQRYLGQSGGWILYTGIDGNVTLRSTQGKGTIVMPLEKTVAAAAVHDDFLAVLFASDDMGLYRLSTKKSYFKTQGTPPTAVDVRIASPYFLGSLVVFPTLDGRFVVVDVTNKELLRSTVVSSEPYFDNIFYFNVIGNTMVAATQHRLFSLSDKERREKYDLRNVVFDSDGIWIATKEGVVAHLTTALQTITKEKFPFAHFLGMIVGKEKVYLLEKEGYLIVMDKAMTQTEVYAVEFDEGITFAAKNAFYVDDKIITLE